MLNDNNSSVNVKCSNVHSCNFATFVIDSLVDNSDEDNSDDVPEINIECSGVEGCSNSEFIVTGSSNLDLNCLNGKSCYQLMLTSGLFDVESFGVFDIYCVHEKGACAEMMINGISRQSVHMICAYGNQFDIRSCDNLRIYCPIYSTDPNSCSVDLANTDSNIEVYLINDGISPNITFEPGIATVTIFCEMDWFYSIIIGPLKNHICLDSTLTNMDIVIPNQRLNRINCDNIKDCYIYMSKPQPTLSEINCPSESQMCSVVWYVLYIRICFNIG